MNPNEALARTLRGAKACWKGLICDRLGVGLACYPPAPSIVVAIWHSRSTVSISSDIQCGKLAMMTFSQAS